MRPSTRDNGAHIRPLKSSNKNEIPLCCCPMADLEDSELCDFSREEAQPDQHQRRSSHRRGSALHALGVNVDASWCSSNLEGSVAGVCRTAAGLLVDGFAKKISAPSTWVAETLAVREALRWVRENRTGSAARTEHPHEASAETDLQVHLFSDSLSLVECLFGREKPPWQAQSIITDCTQIIAQIGGVSVFFVPRESNKAADWIARAHRSNSLPSNWIYCPPHSLFTILCSDLPTNGGLFMG